MNKEGNKEAFLPIFGYLAVEWFLFKKI